MTRELTTDEIIKILSKKIPFIITTTLLIAMLTYLYSVFLIDEQFTSKGTLYVNVLGNGGSKASEDVTKSQLDTSARLVATCSVILKNTKFLDSIAEKKGLSYTANEISSMVTLSAVSNTEVLQVKTVCKNPEHAMLITQGILENAQGEINKIVKAGSVEIINDANLPTSKSSPNITTNTEIGAIIGFILAIIYVFAVSLFDLRVKDEDDVTSKYNIPILGAIPNVAEGNR